MNKTLLTAAMILAALTALGQNDRSKSVETKYLSLPGFDLSTTDTSTITIEFAMKEGVFGTEKLKEMESICKPAGGTIKDAVKVKAYYYEIPFTTPVSYAVAKSSAGTILYAAKASEAGQDVAKYGWDEKMKQASCEYALTSEKLKKAYVKEGTAFKASEQKKYEKEIYDAAVLEAKANVSLSYISEEFDVYSAKGKTFSYVALDAAYDKAMAAYASINKKGFNTTDLASLKEAVAVWEKELLTMNTEDNKARITKDIGKGLHENCIHAYMYLYDFENAKLHADAFIKMFGNFSNNRTIAVTALQKRIYLQKIAAGKNAAAITNIAALNTKASAAKSNVKSKMLTSDKFTVLQSEYISFMGTQTSGLLEEKKKEEDSLIASGELNPYQKWYYTTAVGGPGVLMNLPPSTLSGIPVLTEFPVEICEFTNAKQVVILKNKIASVPADISKLTSLEKLDLTGNQLTTLPAEIGQLKNLETLKLNDNPITSLPEELGKCTKLKTLNIKGTKLTLSQIAEIQALLPGCTIKSN